MKKIILILISASLFANIQAQGNHNIYRKTVICGLFVADAMLPIFSYYWYRENRNTNGLYISSGIDPKMAYDGNLDMRIKLFGHYSRIEPGLTYEYFPAINYESVSLGTDFLIINRKIGWLAGLETSKIWNRNPTKLQEVWSWGINSEIRFLLNNRWSVSYIGNIKTRTELESKKAVYSGYIQINYKIYGK